MDLAQGIDGLMDKSQLPWKVWLGICSWFESLINQTGLNKPKNLIEYLIKLLLDEYEIIKI